MNFMNPMLAVLTGYEIVFLLAIVLILFGAKKLPDLARGLGQGIKEFKKASREVQSEIETAIEMDSNSRPAAPKRLPEDTQARHNEATPQPSAEQRAE
jgi:sec-independent protein translocase protein TatA